MERIRIATAVLSAALLIQIIRSVRREHIRVEYSMAWFAAAVGLLVLSLWDRALDWLSAFLGVEDFASLLLALAGVLFLFTFFRYSIEVSGLKDHDVIVTQKLGMLEWEVRRQAAEIEKLRADLASANSRRKEKGVEDRL